jgi:hypothetical protein
VVERHREATKGVSSAEFCLQPLQPVQPIAAHCSPLKPIAAMEVPLLVRYSVELRTKFSIDPKTNNHLALRTYRCRTNVIKGWLGRCSRTGSGPSLPNFWGAASKSCCKSRCMRRILHGVGPIQRHSAAWRCWRCWRWQQIAFASRFLPGAATGDVERGGG